MKFCSRPLFIAACLVLSSATTTVAQSKTSGTDSTRSDGLAAVLDGVCSCVDSISSTQAKEAITDQIHTCINRHVVVYQLIKKTNDILTRDLKGKGKKNTKYELVIATDESSNAYRESYTDLEREALQRCPELKRLLASNDADMGRTLSLSPIANDWYTKGLHAAEKDDYKTAAMHYRKAVATDPNFIFAWDNLGIAYRHLEQYPKAIDAYEHSLAINPRGATPLMNAAVASYSNKDYQGAIKYYKRLAEVDAENPEVYYGLGQVYAVYLEDYENALPNMTTAFNLYTAQQSPYRADAEEIIRLIYQKMKASGKEKRFYEIMKEENISVDSN
ncbi:MAG: tetratricopeptide repeat protein [Sphingobacteriales bacterium]|nr:MAG: tetratricopeptide repeat protein [Sphingobacteriales bacterium]